MLTSRCLVEGHPRHEGVGCVIDDPNAPNPDPVRRHRARDLARVVLDHAEQDRVELVAALFYRFLMRSAR